MLTKIPEHMKIEAKILPELKPQIPNVRSLSIRDAWQKARQSTTTCRPSRSGSVRLEVPKIFVLIAMLLLVIYAMHEAGKPENWEWMGFKNQVIGTNAANSETDPLPGQTEGFVRSLNEEESTFRSTTGTSKSSDRYNKSPDSSSQDDTIAFQTDLSTIRSAPHDGASNPSVGRSSEIASEFWRSMLGKMNPENQSTFLKMVRTMRQGESLAPEVQASCASLVKTISRSRDRYHQQLFDQLALTADGTEEKKNLSSDLFESQSIWEQKILPAFNSLVKGQDFSVDQLRAIERLQSTIDPILFDQVQDNTAIGWAGDAGAWTRIWDFVLGNSGAMLNTNQPVTFKSVTRIELMSQPRFYRGQSIKVEGWARAGRKIELAKDSQLGIKHQYVLWVRPKETKQGPYCIYTNILPAEFPELTTQFKDINEHVQVDGYFFKIRTYVAADKSATTSPVIVASGMKRIAPVEHTSVHNWQPSRTMFICALVLMPILATAIAWWAYQSSQTQPYQPGKTTTKKINQTLGALKSDPNVQTTHEKIMALYDSDLYESDPGGADENQDELEEDDE